MGRILSRALLGETLRTFAAAFVAFSFIFQVAALYELLNHGASGRQAAIIAPYVIVYTLPFLLPIAALVGAALAYGRLAADNEIVPVTSGGLPATVLVWPAVFFGLLLSFGLYGLSGSLIPYGWLKKKDMTRDFIEDLLDMGDGENKPVTSGDAYSFFFREYHGVTITGIEIVYAPQNGNDPMLIDGADEASAGSSGRPVEIVARSGTLKHDEVQDTLRFELSEVTVTHFEAPKGATAAELAKALRGLDRMPLRGAPNQASIGHLVVSIPITRKMRDKNEYRSTQYLRALLRRLTEYDEFATGAEARERSALDRGLALAPALAAPGAGLGGGALALAGAAGALPSKDSVSLVDDVRRRVRGYLASRQALACGPFLFALVGALVPLRLQHNNRLLPFIVALAIVSVTFFLPFLTARDMVENAGGADPALYWLGPAITAGAAAVLWFDVRRR